jgi:hypothetical protein
MSAELNIDAERADLINDIEAIIDSTMIFRHSAEGKAVLLLLAKLRAARRTQPAVEGAEGLPPLPKPECLHGDGVYGYTAAQVEQIRRVAIAADRQARAQAGTVEKDAWSLLREALAALDTWKDVAPAVSLRADIRAAIEAHTKAGKVQEEQSAGAQGECTQSMLEAAMRAAVTSGVLPKQADEERYLRNWNGMRASINAALAAAPAPDNAAQKGEDTKHIESEAVSAMLWLYRRLHRCYGRPPNVERPIVALAKLAGYEMKFISESFAERGDKEGI